MIKVHIEYCIKWNYGPEFDRVSKFINSNFNNIVITGNDSPPRSGSFEITVSNNLVYSKFQTGSFPTESEIISWFN